MEQEKWGKHAPLLACLQQLAGDLSVLLQLAFSSLLELLQFVSLLLQLEHGLVLLGDARRLLLGEEASHRCEER